MGKILIIEDDDFLRGLLVKKLTEDGHVTEEAEDGEKGLNSLSESKPDLVLLDLLLPGIHGFEVLSWLKQEEDLSDVPVIILSNLGSEKDIEKGYSLGAEDYLVKSKFTPQEITEKVRKFTDS